MRFNFNLVSIIAFTVLASYGLPSPAGLDAGATMESFRQQFEFLSTFEARVAVERFVFNGNDLSCMMAQDTVSFEWSHPFWKQESARDGIASYQTGFTSFGTWSYHQDKNTAHIFGPAVRFIPNVVDTPEPLSFSFYLAGVPLWEIKQAEANMITFTDESGQQYLQVDPAVKEEQMAVYNDGSFSGKFASYDLLVYDRGSQTLAITLDAATSRIKQVDYYNGVCSALHQRIEITRIDARTNIALEWECTNYAALQKPLSFYKATVAEYALNPVLESKECQPSFPPGTKIEDLAARVNSKEKTSTDVAGDR